MAPPHPFRHTGHTLRGPIRGGPAGPSAWRHRIRFGASVTRFVTPQGAPPKAGLTSAVLTVACGWVFRQDNFLSGN
eukprot:4533009-Pyramimonas_sp.AAC.1